MKFNKTNFSLNRRKFAKYHLFNIPNDFGLTLFPKLKYEKQTLVDSYLESSSRRGTITPCVWYFRQVE